MFRSLIFASLAVAALGLSGLSPTTAEAKGFKHHHHHQHHGHHHGHRHGHRHGHWSGAHFAFGGPVYLDPSCYVSRRVSTPWGPRWRTVNRCY